MYCINKLYEYSIISYPVVLHSSQRPKRCKNWAYCTNNNLHKKESEFYLLGIQM